MNSYLKISVLGRLQTIEEGTEVQLGGGRVDKAALGHLALNANQVVPDSAVERSLRSTGRRRDLPESLVAQLGIEPSPSLQTRYRMILSHDPEPHRSPHWHRAIDDDAARVS